MNRIALFGALFLTLAACDDAADDSETEPKPSPACAETIPTISWKRTDVLITDLSRALELSESEVCNEVGVAPCAKVHAVTLGASDPFDKALYRPFAEPLGTTPLAAERVVLSACTTRVTLDSAGAPKVFTSIDLGAASLGDVGPDSAFAKDANELGKRLLSRTLTADELTSLGALSKDDGGNAVSAADAAILVCFTIGTSSEHLFF